MPGKHKNPTISFRVSDYERRAIEATVKRGWLDGGEVWNMCRRGYRMGENS